MGVEVALAPNRLSPILARIKAMHALVSGHACEISMADDLSGSDGGI
jgi:hypothetical protein